MASCLLASIFSCAVSRRRLDDGLIFFVLLWPWRTQCCPRHQPQLIESLLDSRVATSGDPFSRWRSLVLEKGKDSGSEEMVEIFLFITILFLSWDKNGSGMDHCLSPKTPNYMPFLFVYQFREMFPNYLSHHSSNCPTSRKPSPQNILKITVFINGRSFSFHFSIRPVFPKPHSPSWFHPKCVSLLSLFTLHCSLNSSS